MNDRISLLMEMRESDPTEAIGKSKELIESCCKTILGKMQISADKNWDLNNLVKETMKALSITTETVTGKPVSSSRYLEASAALRRELPSSETSTGAVTAGRRVFLPCPLGMPSSQWVAASH